MDGFADASEPRVRLTYPLEEHGQEVDRELACLLGVVADLSGHPVDGRPRPKTQVFHEVDRADFDALFEEIGPRLELDLSDALDPPRPHTAVLRFESVADFEPASVARQLEREASAGLGVGERGRVMSQWLGSVLAHPAFRRLEATWCGLERLVLEVGTSDSVQVRVLDATKRDLGRDFETAADLTESALWERVRDPLGAYGGTPFTGG